MKVKRKIIEIDDELCDGCGQCTLSCAEGALQIIDGKARVIGDELCDGLGACIGECPTGALKIIEREAEEFDETAVEAHLSGLENAGDDKPAFGCPSSQLQVFAPDGTAGAPETGSGLSHWPVKISLTPPNAPFLKNADLLVAADCVAPAFPAFHREFITGGAVMIGCPKFDDTDAYLEKFTDIFKTAGIRKITTVFMEVPCCSGLPGIVKKAMAKAGAEIPYEDIVISRKGKRVSNLIR